MSGAGGGAFLANISVFLVSFLDQQFNSKPASEMSCPLSSILGKDCGITQRLDCIQRQLHPTAVWEQITTMPPWKVAVVVIVLIAKLPVFLAWLKNWTTSRTAVKFNWPVPPEASPEWKGKVIQNPDLFAHERDASLLPAGADTKAQYLTCYDPSTGSHIETIRLENEAEILARLQKAWAAQPSLAASSFAQRRHFLTSLKAWILAHMSDIVAVAVRDTGKTRVDAVFGEILTTLAKIDWLISDGEATLAPSKRKRTLLLAHKNSEVVYEPLGLVAALVSWNYSFHNALGPILAAIFSGNAIVVKGSEQVAWSSRWFIGAVRACLSATGFDPELVQLAICLPGLAEKCITTNPDVRHITFIGSEPVGKLVAKAAAQNLTPTCIELGGKDPAFIMPDADMHFFQSTWMRGAFQSAGQNCIGIELFMVPRSRQQEFIDLLLPRVRALRLGKDVGSLISHAPIARLEKLIAEAVKQGATLHCGGERAVLPDRPEGAYFTPTLISDVRMDMALATEELFAPVMTVVPYDSVEEAVIWLKKQRFGLGAGVYGGKRAECVRVARGLECGMVSINDFGVFYLNQSMPFGGVKASGHSRFAGPEGLRSLCNPKALIQDTVFKVRTSIPPALDYPIKNEDKAWGFLHGLVGLGFGGIGGKIKGIFELVRNG